MGELKYYLTYPDRKSLEFARNDLGNHSGNVIAVYAGPIAGQQGLSMFAWVPTGGTLRANYDPITRKMRFTNNNGAAVTFTLMK